MNGGGCRLWFRLARCDCMCYCSKCIHTKFYVSAYIQKVHCILYCAEYNFEVIYYSSHLLLPDLH